MWGLDSVPGSAEASAEATAEALAAVSVPAINCKQASVIHQQSTPSLFKKSQYLPGSARGSVLARAAVRVPVWAGVSELGWVQMLGPGWGLELALGSGPG